MSDATLRDDDAKDEGSMKPTVLDLRGLNCPYPVLRAASVLKTMTAGERLVLECTDPMTRIDVPHFASQSRHLLRRQWQDGAIFCFEIECGH